MPVLSGTILTVILVVIAVWVIATCIRVVPQATAMVVERFGAYQATWDVGYSFQGSVHRPGSQEGYAQGTGRGLPAAARYHQG